MQFVVALTLLAATGASAVVALCPAPTPKLCSVYFESDTVFFGEVVARRYVGDDADVNWIEYTLKVEQVYRGTVEEVERVLTENSSGRWSADVGRRYLVFRAQGRTGATCGPLDKPMSLEQANEAVDDLLRSAQTTIEGEVVLGGGGPGAERSNAAPSITVVGGELRQTAKAESDGRFRFILRPGRYSVLAGDLRPTTYSRQDLEDVELSSGQCAQFQLSSARTN